MPCGTGRPYRPPRRDRGGSRGTPRSAGQLATRLEPRVEIVGEVSDQLRAELDVRNLTSGPKASKVSWGTSHVLSCFVLGERRPTVVGGHGARTSLRRPRKTTLEGLVGRTLRSRRPWPMTAVTIHHRPAANYNDVVIPGDATVKMLCEGCGRSLETWRLDLTKGQLRPPRNGVRRSSPDAPDRAGLPQVLDYRCPSATCRRQVVVSFLSVEGAVVRAMREGRSVVRIGQHLAGASRGESVWTTTVRAKAPIPGGYRRRPEWPS